MAVLKEPFGRTRNGEDVDKYILRSGELEAEVLTFGATIRRLLAPARSGEPVDVVLGYDSVRGYEDMSLETLRAKGVNDSLIHVDFMIGTKDMNITGITKDGRRVEIFKNGNWAF